METFDPYRKMMALNSPLADLEANKMRLGGVSSTDVLSRLDFCSLAVSMIGVITRETQFGGSGADYDLILANCRDNCRQMYLEISDKDADAVAMHIHGKIVNKPDSYEKFKVNYFCYKAKKMLTYQFSLVSRVQGNRDCDISYKITQDGAALYYNTMMASIPTEEEVTNAIMNYMIDIGDYAGAGAYAEKIIIECVRHQERIKELYEQVRDDIDTSLDEILSEFEKSNKTISDRRASEKAEKEKLLEIVMNISDKEKLDRAKDLIKKLQKSDDYRMRLLVDISKKRTSLIEMKGGGLCRRSGNKAKVLWADMLMRPICEAKKEALGLRQLDLLTGAAFMMKIPELDLVADGMNAMFDLLEKEEKRMQRPLKSTELEDESDTPYGSDECEEGIEIERIDKEVRERLLVPLLREKSEIILSQEINAAIEAGYSQDYILHFTHILYSLILGDSGCELADVILPRFHNEYIDGSNAVIVVHGVENG